MQRAGVIVVLLVAGASLSGCSGPGSSIAPGQGTVLLNAEQHALEIAHAKQTTPLPPGAAWRETAPIDPNAGYEVYDGASMIEFQAMCAWLVEARNASLSGDPARLVRARAVLRHIPTWRSFSDPELGDRNFRDLIEQNVNYAIEGNFEKLAAFLDGPCSPALQ
jgi:hypothetical protein